ncbi:MAG: type-F conjugative transfer system pilin assembly protein TraF [Chlamydiales bacterium]
MIRFTLLISLFLVGSTALQGGWLDRKAEGWAWYEDQEHSKDSQKPSEKRVEESSPSLLPPLSAREEVALIRENLEEKLARAVLTPSEENLAEYMKEQKRWIDQAGEFSNIWTKMLLKQPQLDATLTGYPVSQYGIQVRKEMQLENRTRLIQTLINEYGLFFFYEGGSKVSQAFAMVVQEFAQKYGWEVIAISSDGTLLERFVNNQLDNGIIQQLGIEVFPSLFLVHPKNSEVTPIAIL